MMYQKALQLKGSMAKKISPTSANYLIFYSLLKIRKNRASFIHKLLQTCTTQPLFLNPLCSCVHWHAKGFCGTAIFPKNCITDTICLECLYYCKNNSSFFQILTVSSGLIHFLVILLLNALMLCVGVAIFIIHINVFSVRSYSLFH